MFFGTRKKKTELGKFSSGKCRHCKNSYQYRFIKTTKFLVVFFVNLIPLRSEYESICDACGAAEPVDTRAGKAVARKEFRAAQAGLHAQTVFKIAVLVCIVAAAIALPMALAGAGLSPDAYKNLVDTDGTYNIENREGDLLATVSVADGVKTLSFYDDTSTLVGEPGVDGTFVLHRYYAEDTDDSGLALMADEPGVLTDKYKTVVRTYYYDEANEAFGYSMGIEDLSTIEYLPDKVVYHYVYYLSDTNQQNYTVILFLGDGSQISATFLPSVSGGDIDQFASVTIDTLEDGKLTAQSTYFLDDDALALAKSSGITVDSSADDIRQFIESNGITPSTVYQYAYYKDTKVTSQITFSQPDTEGTMQSLTQSFLITEKNGYFLQQAIQE